MATTIENEAGADLFATSIKLLQTNGKPKGYGGYSLQQPLEEPAGKTLVLNATFNVFDPIAQEAYDLRISLKGDPTYIAVTREGKFAGHSKGMTTLIVDDIGEQDISYLKEITAGVAQKLLGGQI